MDLNACLAFVTVAECRSFSAAARQLQIPRSTVGARISALEARLGARLFRRTTRQLALTEEGVCYFEAIGPAIATLRQADRQIGLSGDVLKGAVRISVPVDFPANVLSRAIREFRIAHPGVRFEVTVEDAVADFMADRIDMAIRGGHPGSEAFVARQIGSFRFGLFANRDYLERAGDGKSAMAATSIRDRLQQSDAISRWSLDGAVSANSFGLLRQLAMDGAGAFILPAHLCDDAVRVGQLVEIPLREPAQQIGLYLVYPSRRDISPTVRLFSDALIRIVESV